jgi:hypothetical protein
MRLRTAAKHWLSCSIGARTSGARGLGAIFVHIRGAVLCDAIRLRFQLYGCSCCQAWLGGTRFCRWFDPEESGPLSIADRQRCPMKRALVQRHLEEAESRIQRGLRNVDHQRKTVSDLERENQDATIAKALLRMFEKALAVHVAERDRLTKRLARPPRQLAKAVYSGSDAAPRARLRRRSLRKVEHHGRCRAVQTGEWVDLAVVVDGGHCRGGAVRLCGSPPCNR